MEYETYWKKVKPFNLDINLKKKNPVILGFSAYSHDSSACIIKNGKVMAAAEEERFTRVKHDNGFPINAIKFSLKEADVTEVDAVVFFENPLEKLERINETITKSRPSRETEDKIKKLWQEKKMPEKIQLKLMQETGLKNNIIFLNHHLSHAASSYFMSPFEEAAILTIDGVGEKITTAIGYAKDKEIKLNKCIEFPHSVGLMYTALTTFLGFKANNDEYKVMGLAPYGKINRITNKHYKKMTKLIVINYDGSFRLNMEYFGHEGFESKAYTEKMVELFGITPRGRDSEVTQEYKDIAAALQMVTEDVVFIILNHLFRETNCRNLCIAGGVGLNSVLNGKIAHKTPFQNIFIQPASGDSGTAIGAAKYIQHLIDPSANREHQQHSHYGPEFSNNEIKKFLNDNRIRYYEFNSRDELLETTAGLIYQRNVIGWFQGKMEWGARSLGNRSILASPLYEDMRDVLNAKVKHREMFRPFAPVVCVDDVEDNFECNNPVPEPTDYMLMVYPIKKNKQKLIPAATHVDGSGRLQTIRKSQNPSYYDLIKKFGKISGIPILINTSFNIRGEPIVCTPQDAYRCMMGTEIDYLVIGKFLVKRTDNPKDIWNSEVQE